MGDFDAVFQQDLKEQSWSLYGVGLFFILLRLYARARRLGGVANYQIDDYLMMLAGGLYTALIVCLNVITQGGGSNLYPPELDGTFSPEEVRERIYGSKIVVVSEQAMLNCIYSIKACMLIMYTRLTLGLTQQKVVRYLAAYVAMGWLASETAFFTACRPFDGYWGMPPPDPQCTTLQYYAIVTGCFNISSDLLMLGIPIPLVLRISIPWRQKLVLVFIFGMGTFIIIAALLTKIFNLSNIWDPSYMLWYTREASVAVYVSNLPMIWPLLREWFPVLRALNPSSYMPGSDEQRHKHHYGGAIISSVARNSHRRGLRLNSGRPARRHSLHSLDTTYDVEMAVSSKEAEAMDGKGASNDSIGVAAATCDSREHVVGRLGLDQTIVMEHQAGEIQVERTIVVEERRARGGEAARFDWERQGISTHKVDAEGMHPLGQ